MAINTINELEKIITSFSKGEKTEVNSALQRLFSQEVEIDDVRRAIFEELTKSELSPKYREDLKGLVEHLDKLADHVKDSARSVKVLIDIIVPKEILDEYVSIAKNLTECASMLGECIEMLGIDPFRARELAHQVDVSEDKVDDGYLLMKSLFIKYSKDMDVALLLELKDLLYHIETTADMCADTADHIRTLAEGEINLP